MTRASTSKVEIAKILNVATSVRLALTSSLKHELPNHWTQFPRGTCGDTSLALGAFLVDAGFVGLEYVCGERGSHEDGTYSSHAWLQRNNLVVDITADQFLDAPGAVIVADDSKWHRGFYIYSTDFGDFREYPIEQVLKLHQLYDQLKLRLSI